MTKIDLEQLTYELRHLEHHQKLYKLLKHELTQLGFWQNKPRGNPSKGYAAMKERESDKKD